MGETEVQKMKRELQEFCEAKDESGRKLWDGIINDLDDLNVDEKSTCSKYGKFKNICPLDAFAYKHNKGTEVSYCCFDCIGYRGKPLREAYRLIQEYMTSNPDWKKPSEEN